LRGVAVAAALSTVTFAAAVEGWKIVSKTFQAHGS
jgi:hypothetical protein